MTINRIRQTCLPIVLSCSLAGAGCATALKNKDQDVAKTGMTASKSEIDTFVNSWNSNAKKIQSIRCDQVDIDGKSEGTPYTLSAKLAWRTGDNFRLAGSALGKPEVDLGSNDKEIWFWMARAEPPAVYFCKRDELHHVKLATPFQPDWLVEALGVAQIDPKQYRPDVAGPDYFTLKTVTAAPNGQTVTKRLVIDKKSNRVECFELWGQGKKLASAWIDPVDYHQDPQSGAWVPRKVRIEWPEAKTRLTLVMKRSAIQLNGVNDEMASSLFKRDGLDRLQTIDLARINDAGPAARENGRPARAARTPEYEDRQIQPARAAALTGDIETEPQSSGK